MSAKTAESKAQVKSNLPSPTDSLQVSRTASGASAQPLDSGLAVARRFGAGAKSVPDARTFLAEALDAFSDEVVLMAQLLASELVTNAVLHARTPLVLGIELQGPRLRVTVEDGSAGLPARRHSGADATQGRGLVLVESLASAWGCDPTQSGKRVWFELPALALVST